MDALSQKVAFLIEMFEVMYSTSDPSFSLIPLISFSYHNNLWLSTPSGSWYRFHRETSIRSPEVSIRRTRHTLSQWEWKPKQICPKTHHRSCGPWLRRNGLSDSSHHIIVLWRPNTIWSWKRNRAQREWTTSWQPINGCIQCITFVVECITPKIPSIFPTAPQSSGYFQNHWCSLSFISDARTIQNAVRRGTFKL